MLLGVSANSPHCLHESIRRNQTLKDGYFVAQNIIILLPIVQLRTIHTEGIWNIVVLDLPCILKSIFLSQQKVPASITRQMWKK